ncbi:GrlR family regulatory protein [Serratia sp. PL7]|uniref:GrlR family regulatory protein n=1 Tax=Serratia sp. PL7 TaxID=2952201 RepID=UPI001A0381AA|nr:GrlR family regulatory protein [Serratia sp. PL7]MBE0148301.1 negative regulator GrlR [Serratia fonticola]
MKNGIYYVVFQSNNQDFGTGTVVVKDNKVNGGDYGFTYKGMADGNKVTLHVSQHDRNVTSVFGGVSAFNLDLVVNESGNNYVLKGTVAGMPSSLIQIQAKFIGDII